MRSRQLLWFAGLWAASVATMLLVAGLLKLFFGAVLT
ncbi:MAG TPA: DUF2474 family protein [Rhizomicrobium sp.]|nr:DUF2474 family protein [Rhizomicrobium sp.]